MRLGGFGAIAAVGGLLTIGRADRDRPIFEFRALGKLYRDDLVETGLALWDYVEMAHGRQPGGPNALSKGALLWNRIAS